jgi:D-glycero-alpha-D-manno-heptose-7-phosphate kinase
VPPFSEREGGAVVNAAINRYTYTSLVPRSDGAIKMYSGDFDLFVEVKSFRDIEYDGNLDMVKAAIRTLGIERGMDLYVRCDAPPGSGTGSSASIAVALIGLLNHLQPKKLSPHEIAQLARQLEFQELGIAGGKQDQVAAAVGGINFIEFQDPAVSSSQLSVPREVVLDLEKHLVLCYTGKSRLSGNLIDNVMGNYERGEKTNTDALRRLKEIAHEVKTALLAGETQRFGELIGENWECQRRLDASITNPQIDHLFEVASRSGAIGGKALGAGGGGCLLFMAAENEEHRLRAALEAEGTRIIDFNFDSQGLQTWTVRKT